MKVSRIAWQSVDKQWLGILYFLFIKSLNLQENGSPGLGNFISVEGGTSIHPPIFPHHLPSSVESVVQ